MQSVGVRGREEKFVREKRVGKKKLSRKKWDATQCRKFSLPSSSKKAGVGPEAVPYLYCYK